VAGGRTNRQIADALLLSQKTVERHLSNIFTKLDVHSRAEAARIAAEQGLTQLQGATAIGSAGRRDRPM